MRRWLVIASCALLACKDKDKPTEKPTPTPPPADANDHANNLGAGHPELPIDAPPPPVGEWALCKAGFEKAMAGPATRRLETILAACKPCGEWQPILEWQTLQEDGGPNRKLIEQAMAGCKAWCTPTAKVRFMGALDDARAKKSRTPWRELAAQCKEAVSAVPDGRFVTAPYFALDRIARWAGEQPDGAKALEAVDIPLPAVTQTGVGVQLPTSPLTKPEVVPAQITVTPAGLTIGTMPRAKLTPAGIVPQGDAYPGAQVTPKQLPAMLKKLGKAAIFASPKLPAAKIAEVALHGHAGPVVLASASALGPAGWEQHGVIPIALDANKPRADAVVFPLGATPDDATAKVKATGAAGVKDRPIVIQLEDGSTVGGLATLLGALAFFEVPSVTLVPPKKK